MAALTEQRIEKLLAPYIQDLPDGLVVPAGLSGQLGGYLDLLLRWNARTNLTAVREPEEIVQRHFGESLFAGGVLRRWMGDGLEVLDLGSGAGFPGLPVQILLPHLNVTLAESQGKKAAFLREVVRVLGLKAEVWAGRAEGMPSDKQFDAVLLRAVDGMAAMVEAGRSRVRQGGVLLEMTGAPGELGSVYRIPNRLASFVRVSRVE